MIFRYFTDGSVRRNGDSGSWAWFEKTTKESEIGYCKTYTTSMRMEMFALQYAMEHALSHVYEDDHVHIHSDCKQIITLLNDAIDSIYNGEDFSIDRRDNDLWAELLSTALLLERSCLLELRWIRRDKNTVAHDLSRHQSIVYA